MNINVKKRAAYARRVKVVLTEILNDPEVMPNDDCVDLVTSINRLWFGKTVRDIFIEVRANLRDPGVNLHNKLMAEATAAGRSTYVDLTDVMVLASFLSIVEEELQRRLNLRYLPRLHYL